MTQLMFYKESSLFMGWGAAGRGERTSEIGQPVKGEGGAQNFGHSPKGGGQIMGGQKSFWIPLRRGQKFFILLRGGVIDFLTPREGGMKFFSACRGGSTIFERVGPKNCRPSNP